VSEWSDMSIADCCFSELALSKSNSVCWSRIKQTSSSSHWKLTCSRHDIYEKLTLDIVISLPWLLLFNLDVDNCHLFYVVISIRRKSTVRLPSPAQEENKNVISFKYHPYNYSNKLYRVKSTHSKHTSVSTCNGETLNKKILCNC
jgi:hypothetical protein